MFPALKLRILTTGPPVKSLLGDFNGNTWRAVSTRDQCSSRLLTLLSLACLRLLHALPLSLTLSPFFSHGFDPSSAVPCSNTFPYPSTCLPPSSSIVRDLALGSGASSGRASPLCNHQTIAPLFTSRPCPDTTLGVPDCNTQAPTTCFSGSVLRANKKRPSGS